MEVIVSLIDRVLHDPENEQNIAEVRAEVNALMANYPLFAWQQAITLNFLWSRCFSERLDFFLYDARTGQIVLYNRYWYLVFTDENYTFAV